jgi:methylamine dehydrogenase light chain
VSQRAFDGRIGANARAFDGWLEATARQLARRTSRRGFLARLGAAFAGAAAMPLLPVARAGGQEPAAEIPEPGDPTQCDYWRYCAIDGFLSACCGGTHTACPPGTEMSLVTWIGTCKNPVDGKDYVISYNDCCGNALCARCFCNRNEGDRPVYQAAKSNDINWCMGTTTTAYSSTVARVLGPADDA